LCIKFNSANFTPAAYACLVLLMLFSPLVVKKK
jgi:hypothetical protein